MRRLLPVTFRCGHTGTIVTGASTERGIAKVLATCAAQTCGTCALSYQEQAWRWGKGHGPDADAAADPAAADDAKTTHP